MVKTKQYTIRTMKASEVHMAIEWAAREGWNPGVYDAEAFIATDPDGFLIGELDGKAISCISVVAYDETFGFLGFYIVKPEYRGQGYGYKIWQKGMDYLGSRNIDLDGVVAQQDNYKKSGFQFAYSNIRYEGIAPEVKSEKVIELKDIPFEQILDYDNRLFPTSRPDFLRVWINNPKSITLGYTENKELKGYAVLRPCRTGYKIGPLFADNEEIAKELFYGLLQNIPGETFYLDTPEVNKKAVELAESHKMKVVFGTARMYTRELPELPVDKIFGVTTFELG